jgi:hypothetical protein
MSTVNISNAADGVAPGSIVENVIAAPAKTTTDAKVTAAEIETDCPYRLQQIGKEIAERFEKAHKQNESASNHLIAVNELLAEAKTICNAGGFKKFRELFCPQLGKSQAYVLHAIGAGKKTLAKHRNEERERKQRTRANQRAVAANSGTVPETSAPVGKAPAAPAADCKPETNIAPELAKPRSGCTANDKDLLRFTAIADEILRGIANKNVDYFANIGQAPDALARLGKFFTDLANLKSHLKPIPSTPPRSDTKRISGGVA